MSNGDTKKPIYEPSKEIESPKYSYQDIDTRTYSVDCSGSAKDQPAAATLTSKSYLFGI